jgi:hypothetical protein
MEAFGEADGSAPGGAKLLSPILTLAPHQAGLYLAPHRTPTPHPHPNLPGGFNKYMDKRLPSLQSSKYVRAWPTGKK